MTEMQARPELPTPPPEPTKKPTNLVLVSAMVAALTGAITSGVSLLLSAPIAISEYLDKRFTALELEVEKARQGTVANSDVAADLYSDLSSHQANARHRLNQMEVSLQAMRDRIEKEQREWMRQGFRLEELEKDVAALQQALAPGITPGQVIYKRQ